MGKKQERKFIKVMNQLAVEYQKEILFLKTEYKNELLRARKGPKKRFNYRVIIDRNSKRYPDEDDTSSGVIVDDEPHWTPISKFDDGYFGNSGLMCPSGLIRKIIRTQLPWVWKWSDNYPFSKVNGILRICVPTVVFDKMYFAIKCIKSFHPYRQEICKKCAKYCFGFNECPNTEKFMLIKKRDSRICTQDCEFFVGKECEKDVLPIWYTQAEYYRDYPLIPLPKECPYQLEHDLVIANEKQN